VLIQERLIARVRALCHVDERLVAALTYGSFVSGEADAHSDIEFWLFFDASAEAVLDKRAWLHAIATIRYSMVNEFGAHVVFFPGLIRGEFHFATAGDIRSVATWPARGGPTDQMIVVDRNGALRRALESLPPRPGLPAAPEEVDELCGRFANWLVLAHHVARRGELLRAVDALAHAQRHLLWMARLAENRTQHWLTPSRSAETDLPAGVLLALRQVAGVAEPDSLAAAVAAAWVLGRRYWQLLANRTGCRVPDELFTELDTAFGT
jgi:lincosamide nucleotidyltransferase